MKIKVRFGKWFYQKVANYYFYRWIKNHNNDDLERYEEWIDRKHECGRIAHSANSGDEGGRT